MPLTSTARQNTAPPFRPPISMTRAPERPWTSGIGLEAWLSLGPSGKNHTNSSAEPEVRETLRPTKRKIAEVCCPQREMVRATHHVWRRLGCVYQGIHDPTARREQACC